MTTVANSTVFPTLLDHMNRMDPNGAIAKIVESLSKLNPVIEDAVFVEGNLPTGHRFTSRTSLPSIGRRRFNEGVAPTKSTTSQITEATTMLSAFSVVDVAEARLNGNEVAFRASEDSAFMQSMMQQAEAELLYGNSDTDPSDMKGLVPRFSSTTGTAGKQIILHDASASGNDQTSMALVGWGQESVFAIYPKGSTGGISYLDMGIRPWDPNNDGKKFPAFVGNWHWDLGLCVKDYRQVSIIRNIDVSNLTKTGNTLIQSAITAYHRIFAPQTVKLVWYCNRLVSEYLHQQAVDSTKQSTLRIEEIGGRPVTMLLGIPVRISDTLTKTESIIS